MPASDILDGAQVSEIGDWLESFGVVFAVGACCTPLIELTDLRLLDAELIVQRIPEEQKRKCVLCT